MRLVKSCINKFVYRFVKKSRILRILKLIFDKLATLKWRNEQTRASKEIKFPINYSKYIFFFFASKNFQKYKRDRLLHSEKLRNPFNYTIYTPAIHSRLNITIIQKSSDRTPPSPLLTYPRDEK